jgi:hypothetical protein
MLMINRRHLQHDTYGFLEQTLSHLSFCELLPQSYGQPQDSDNPDSTNTRWIQDTFGDIQSQLQKIQAIYTRDREKPLR